MLSHTELADASSPPRNSNTQESGDADHLKHDGLQRESPTSRVSDFLTPVTNEAALINISIRTPYDPHRERILLPIQRSTI